MTGHLRVAFRAARCNDERESFIGGYGSSGSGWLGPAPGGLTGTAVLGHVGCTPCVKTTRSATPLRLGVLFLTGPSINLRPSQFT